MKPSTNGTLRTVEILGAAVCATVFYIYVLGLFPLNPLTAKWLLAGDPAQHYLGWYFFRNEGWSWPPGRIQGFGLPLGGSVAVTDSIPLLALILKPFSPWLPESFQYFGLWMLACFILSGYFGVRLMAHATRRPLLRLLGALFFILSPPLMFRAYGHESLMAHWLLLAGMDTYLRGWSARSWAQWSILAALCHPYLLLMVLGLMAASAADALWIARTRLPGRLFMECGAIGAGVFLALWLAGYLIGGGTANEGYGYFSMNILALVDPIKLFDPAFRASRFLKQHDFHPDFMPYGQYEGFLYLGAGMLSLVIMAACIYLATPGTTAKSLMRKYWPLAGVALVFWLLALSNKIMLGQLHLVTIPLPELLRKALSVFRASGRLGWPLFYLLNLVVLAVIVRRLPYRSALIILAFGILLQFVDQTKEYKEFKNLYRQRLAWESPLKSPEWDRLAAGASRLVILPPHPPMEQIYIPFAHFAARHRLATNAAHLARSEAGSAETYGKKLAERLANGEYDPTVLYLFPDPAGLEILPPDLRSRVIQLDGYHVLPPGQSG
jgi:hypothetical protein